jgi:hypothetical protein
MKNLWMVFLILVLVSSCGPIPSHEKFVAQLNQDFDDGVPVETLISKLEEGYYFEASRENVLADDSLEFMFLDELEQKNVENLLAANDIKKFYKEGCEFGARGALYVYVAYPAEVNLTFEGVLLEKGICSEKNPKEAAVFYQKALKENPNYYVALARFGAL